VEEPINTLDVEPTTTTTAPRSIHQTSRHQGNQNSTRDASTTF
jgi:hypothetical protein